MENPLKTYFELFMQEKGVAGLSPRTLSDYQWHFAAFMRHVPQGEDYRAGVLSYLGGDIAANTHKPTSRVVNIDDDIIARLLTLPDRSSFSGLRDFSLILFSIDTGTRPNEALSLAVGDFNFDLRVVTIPAAIAKTRQPRTLPLSEQTVSAVRALLSAHSPHWVAPRVFCSNRGTPLEVHSWGRNLKTYSDKLGVKISPYCLRHVAALSLLRGGMSVFALKKTLGHSTIGMTEKYVSLELSDLRREHSKASLLNIVAPLSSQEEAPRVQQFTHRVMKISPKA